MNICKYMPLTALITLVHLAPQASALTFPYTEDFVADAANWKNTASLDPTYVANGGPDDSGYLSTELSFLNLPSSPVLFRAQDQFGSSGGAFKGDWLADDVGVLRAYVRHDAPIALNFFARVATENNHPAVAVETATSVEPGIWSLVEFDLQQSNPLLTVEGPPAFYNSTFSNVYNVQVGVSLPEALVTDATTYTFDVDQVSIGVPEPTSWLLTVGAAISGLLWRRARGR